MANRRQRLSNLSTNNRRLRRNLRARFRRFNRSNRQHLNIDINTNRNGFGINNTIRELVDFYGNGINGNYIILEVNNTYYTLSQNFANDLLNIIQNQVFQVEEQAVQVGSDVEIMQSLTYNQPNIIIHKRVINNNRREGGFFRYFNKTNIDLKRFGIYKNAKELRDNNEQCLVLALKQFNIDDNKLNTIKMMAKNSNIPQIKLNEIADIIDKDIKIIQLQKDGSTRIVRKKGKNKHEEEICIGLLESHYFANFITKYSSYYIKNYEELKDIDGGCYIVKKYKGKFLKSYNRGINAFNLIKTLLDNKDKLLKEITISFDMMKTQFYKKIKEEITSLEYDDYFNTKLIMKPELEEDKKENKFQNEYENWFIDFETTEDEVGKLDALLIRGINDKDVKFYFKGVNSGRKMLDYFNKSGKTRVRLIAHNMSFDMRFIINHLQKISNKGYLMKGKKLLNMEGWYKKVKIQFKDSYNLITMSLRDFGTSFNLKQDKEVIAYKIYNDKEELKRGLYNIEKAKKVLIKEIEMKGGKIEDKLIQFEKNIDKWGLRVGEDFKHIEYNNKYCEMDCLVLRDGYNKFKKMMSELTGMDIDNVLTIASLSDKNILYRGGYDNTYKLSGIPRSFIQKCVVGGRTMSNNNEKYHVKNCKINDFDAVSLYPSAMVRLAEELGGYLMGKPKVIKDKQLNMDFLNGVDGYFVEIEITKVGKKRNFSLISYKNDNLVRNFDNNLVGKKINIDKIALEDAIKFMEIEFKLIKGYYYNEGRNNKIGEIMSKNFEERKKLKAKKNPAQIVYKAMMNCGYGKTCLKEIDTKKLVVKEEDLEKRVNYDYNHIMSYSKIFDTDFYTIKKRKSINNHFNSVHLGVEVLSMSKRIMNEVICLAEDLGLTIYYQDTDSIHINDEDIEILVKEYKNKYGKELIGKNLEQFHSDFELKGAVKDIISKELIVLGKKCYIDRLEGLDENNEKVEGLHFRMKGVPQEVVKYTARLRKQTVLELFTDLYKGEEITFDLTMGGYKLALKFKDDMTIINQKNFKRKLKF